MSTPQRRFRHPRLRILLFLCGLLLPALARAEPEPGWQTLTLPPGIEPQLVALLADPGFEVPLDGGYVFDSIQVRRNDVVCTLSKAGQPVARIRLLPREMAVPGEPVGASFAIEPELLVVDPLAHALVARAVAGIAQRDTTDLYRRFSVRPQLCIAFGGLLLWALALLVHLRGRVRELRITSAARMHHMLPAALQVVFFAYWALYWPPVRAHMLFDVPLQLAFALLLDALLALTLRRTWEAGFAVFPIVLSTNLFIWFPPHWLWLGFLVSALAIGSKWLFRRADGRHIFNPSAFGIAVVGGLAVLQVGIQYQDIALELQLPPNMLELMFLLALLPVVRFGLGALSLPAALAMLAVLALVPASQRLPTPFWPAWFLSITLFAGDPMTAARHFGGRVLHGACLGLGISGFAWLLVQLTGLDYFAKVFPVVLCNLAVPLFDRFGLWFDTQLLRRTPQPPPPTGRPEWWLRWLPVAAWVLVFLLARTDAAKSAIFDPHLFRDLGALGVVEPTLGQKRCELNRPWCKAFDFADELSVRRE